MLHGLVKLTSGSDMWQGSPGDLLIIPDALHSLEAIKAPAVLLRVGLRGR